jgi:hypothetical protein
MKKIFTVLLIIGCFQGLIAQVVVNTHYLDLKKSKAYHEALAAKEANNSQLVVFASDKNTVTALHYNRALFYIDSLSMPRPDTELSFMAGYSFNANGNPQVYWANSDYTKILAQNFDFGTKALSTNAMRLPVKDQYILSIFSENNAFYILAMPEEGDKLKLYVFNDGSYHERTLDFSAFTFYDSENDITKLTDLLKEYSLQKMEGSAFNALPVAGSKIKLYVTADKMVLTLDHHPAVTQLFTIESDTIKERLVPQFELAKVGKSNSFYFKDRLYQLKLNQQEMVLGAIDLTTGKTLQTYSARNQDTITFKNSPFLIQTGRKGASEIKDTKKFLDKAGMGMASVSVYKTPDDLMVVAGGVRNVITTGDVIMGVALSGALIMGGGGDALNLLDSDNIQTVYFESLFDNDFKYHPYNQGQLAIDHISQFMANNSNVTLETVIPYNDYYLLGFYDARAKKYVLLKFQDDYGY